MEKISAMKLFWEILKYFGIAAGTLATLYGAFTILDNIRDDISDVKHEMVIFRSTADTLLNISRTYDDRILRNTKAIEYSTGQTQLVVDSYLKHLRNDKSLTKEEFVEYMDPFLEYIKKNSNPELYQQSIQSIREDSEDQNTPGNMMYSSSH